MFARNRVFPFAERLENGARLSIFLAGSVSLVDVPPENAGVLEMHDAIHADRYSGIHTRRLLTRSMHCTIGI